MSRLFSHVSPGEFIASTPMIVDATLVFSLAAAFLALWSTARDYRVFRSMGIYLTLAGIQVVWIYFGGEKSAWALAALTAPVLVVIAGEAMRVRNRRWALLIWPFCLLEFCLGWFHRLEFLQPLSVDVSSLFLCVLIVQGFRHGQRRDRQIAIAFTFLVCIRWAISPYFRAITHVPLVVLIGGWEWGLPPAAMILLGTATLVIFVRDLMDDRRAKLRMDAELEAARSVQQVLVPDEIPGVPGFRIESAYKPAGQVGGDFFQILPLPGASGGMLVVIGDVSGKGMPAAMTVALLVGTVRTLAHYTESPGEILGAMNARMLTRSHGGFTTCLVLRVGLDGTLLVANAGHIAPYLDGKELQLENGLPLGISAEAVYAEAKCHMAVNQQISLVTDGVVEARDKSGALFGFERTAALSTQRAETIAEAAEAFGQDDDITALTLLRVC